MKKLRKAYIALIMAFLYAPILLLILCAEENVEGNHGATIGALDDDTLFYFASRGMDEKTAERVMTRAKLERICRRIPDAQSREETENLLKTVMNDGQDD